MIILYLFWLGDWGEIRFHYDNLNMGYPPTEPRTFVFGLVLSRLSNGRVGTGQIVILFACSFGPRIPPKHHPPPALSEEEQELKTTFLRCAI